MLTILDKKYDGESLYDLPRDVEEALNRDYNSAIADVPQDENGVQLGTFVVKIEWVPTKEQS